MHTSSLVFLVHYFEYQEYFRIYLDANTFELCSPKKCNVFLNIGQ